MRPVCRSRRTKSSSSFSVDIDRSRASPSPPACVCRRSHSPRASVTHTKRGAPSSPSSKHVLRVVQKTPSETNALYSASVANSVGRSLNRSGSENGQQETAAELSAKTARLSPTARTSTVPCSGSCCAPSRVREASAPVGRLARPRHGLKVMPGSVFCDGVGQPFRRDGRIERELVGEYLRPDRRVRRTRWRRRTAPAFPAIRRTPTYPR